MIGAQEAFRFAVAHFLYYFRDVSSTFFRRFVLVFILQPNVVLFQWFHPIVPGEIDFDLLIAAGE